MFRNFYHLMTETLAANWQDSSVTDGDATERDYDTSG